MPALGTLHHLLKAVLHPHLFTRGVQLDYFEVQYFLPVEIAISFSNNCFVKINLQVSSKMKKPGDRRLVINALVLKLPSMQPCTSPWNRILKYSTTRFRNDKRLCIIYSYSFIVCIISLVQGFIKTNIYIVQSEC